MLKDLFMPINDIYLPMVIFASLCFAIWIIYGFLLLLKKGNKREKNILLYKWTIILATISLAFLLVILYKFQKFYFLQIDMNKDVEMQKYSILFLISFFIAALLGLVLYTFIIYIRKTNDKKRDRKSFRWFPKLLCSFLLLISFVFVCLFLYKLKKYYISANTSDIKEIFFDLLFFANLENFKNINYLTVLSMYSISIYIICKYVLLALKEKTKTKTIKYVGDTILGLIFVGLFSLFNLQLMQEKAGLFSQIRLLPIFFIVAIFSYKYGYRKTVPFSLLVAALLSSINTTYNFFSMSEFSVNSNPIALTLIGIILMHYIPTVAMSLFGSIIGKKNVFGGALLANISIFIIRMIPLTLVSVVFGIRENTDNILNSILGVTFNLLYEHIVTFIMFNFLIIVKEGRILLSSERENNKLIDRNWVKFENNFAKKNKKNKAA